MCYYSTKAVGKMARPAKYKVCLTDDQRKKLKQILRSQKTCRTLKCRCQILLDLDTNYGKVLTHEQSARANGVSMSMVENVAKQYATGGMESVIKLKRNVNSDNARRKVDGRAEAQIVQLACGPVPEGHARWTLRLLEKEANVILETPVSREAIRRILKKRS